MSARGSSCCPMKLRQIFPASHLRALPRSRPTIRARPTFTEPGRRNRRCDHFLIWELRNMNRNILYGVIGALAVATTIFGYQYYQERQKTTGVEISVGKGGISIEKK